MDADSLPFYIDAMRLPDIPQVMQIERRVFVQAWSSGIYERELAANPWSHYYVIRAKQPEFPGLLAYGGIWQMDISAHIPTIAVHPHYQRRHLGGYLLAYLLIQSYNLGCSEATLEVRVSNVAAQHLYQRLGFEVVGRRPHYYANNNEDALIMTRPHLQLATLQAELAEQEQQLRQSWLAHSPQG
ncbi:MAG: ribosomal protein S18-alanine N-acetyltransferase [Chloroflexi bacterium]|nr:ribosomal protein S18-alanine N-acetyltransferase [Chloroflexota bacterium]